MALQTRFTERFGIDHPIVCAPMDVVSTAQLATAVSRAGGLGQVHAIEDAGDVVPTMAAQAEEIRTGAPPQRGQGGLSGGS